MKKLRNNEFNLRNFNRAISLDRLETNEGAQQALENAGISTEKLRESDTNQDGFVDTKEAWQLIDSFERRGSSKSIIAKKVIGGEEQLTAAGQAEEALSTAFQSDMLAEIRLRSNNHIAYVGMSDGGKSETRALRSFSRKADRSKSRDHIDYKGGSVEGIYDQGKDDRVRVRGRQYNLTEPTQVEQFVATLKLPTEQSKKIEKVINQSGVDAKDEIAKLAQLWSKAEHGHEIPSRMVFSGHHTNGSLWGNNNGTQSWDNIAELARAMPKAAQSIEDIHWSACYSGFENNMSQYRQAFPHLKTIWAYDGSAPGTWSGALSHLETWEKATRGTSSDGVNRGMQDLLDNGTRKADVITTWNVAAPDTSMAQATLSDLLAVVTAHEGTFGRFFSGHEKVEDTQSGPMRQYYNLLQSVLGRSDLPEDVRSHLQERSNQTIRTIYYNKTIRKTFQKEYQPILDKGYRSLGRETPNFARLSRKEAMQEIKTTLEGIDAQSTTETEQLRMLLNGLWNLDSQTIPFDWI